MSTHVRFKNVQECPFLFYSTSHSHVLFSFYPRVLVEQLTRMEQEYVRQAEEKIMQLELSKTHSGMDGVLVLGGDKAVAVVPTTEELCRYIHNPSTLQEMDTLRTSAMQQSEEKVAIAKQTYSLVDATVKRLDHDLAMLEKYVLVVVVIIIEMHLG